MQKEWNNIINEIKELNHDNKLFLYHDISKIILNKIYDKNICFPINIRKIIQSMNIDIAEMNLNVDCGFNPDKVHMFNNSSIKRTIYIHYNLSEKLKRYLLAYGLSCYILDEITNNKKESNSREYSDPLFLKSTKYIDADYLAAYLMIPLITTLDFMEQYIAEMKEKDIYPIDNNEWIRLLSQESQIDSKNTITSFYKIRELATHIYNSKNNEEIKKYEKLFR